MKATVQPKIECFRYEDNSAGRKKLAKECYDRVLGKEAEKYSARDDNGGMRPDNSDAVLPG